MVFKKKVKPGERKLVLPRPGMDLASDVVDVRLRDGSGNPAEAPLYEVTEAELRQIAEELVEALIQSKYWTLHKSGRITWYIVYGVMPGLLGQCPTAITYLDAVP